LYYHHLLKGCMFFISGTIPSLPLLAIGATFPLNNVSCPLHVEITLWFWLFYPIILFSL
jgi:hypothetical protein